MKGNWVGVWTALFTFLGILWQGYTEYQRQHPTIVSQPVVEQQQVPPAGVPIYWQDGQQWYCKVNGQVLIWRPVVNTPAAHVAQYDVAFR